MIKYGGKVKIQNLNIKQGVNYNADHAHYPRHRKAKVNELYCIDHGNDANEANSNRPHHKWSNVKAKMGVANQ